MNKKPEKKTKVKLCSYWENESRASTGILFRLSVQAFPLHYPTFNPSQQSSSARL